MEYLKVALQAAEGMGNVDTELVELSGKEIKPCLGCKSDRCGGTCVISDYMQDLYPKLRGCDGLILASPSYFGTFTGQLKLFIDRLRVMRHNNFELGNVVVGTLSVAGRRHGGQEITNIDLVQAMMRHNTIIVNDGTAVCQLGATGWSHTHEDSTEFFYVVSGQGEFMDDTEWKAIQKGDAFKAPQGMSHSIKNTGSETLVLFSTFSPATR